MPTTKGGDPPPPQRDVQIGQRAFNGRLMPVVDDVDLGVIGDRPQGDMRDALIDETLPHITVRRGVRRLRMAEIGFLL